MWGWGALVPSRPFPSIPLPLCSRFALFCFASLGAPRPADRHVSFEGKRGGGGKMRQQVGSGSGVNRARRRAFRRGEEMGREALECSVAVVMLPRSRLEGTALLN